MLPPSSIVPKSIVRRTDWPQSTSRPVVTPLQPSVVYASPDPDALDAQYSGGTGYTYAREGHPNELCDGSDWISSKPFNSCTIGMLV